MPPPGLPPDWEEFRSAMRNLEERVARLEARLEQPAPVVTPSKPALAPAPASVALAVGAGAVPAAGRTLLVLAGAYVLRALTESRVLPQHAGILAGILYAMLWIAWAARMREGRRVETVLYSLASALVLAPLLWESSVRLHAIPTWIAASVLLLFTVFGLLISWRRNLLAVATVATLTGVLSGAALLMGTHDLLPFTVLLLAIAAAVEVSACLDHWLSERWVAALAADLAVLVTTLLVTESRGLPDTYATVPYPGLLAALVALPAIYLASTMLRTLKRGFAFTAFEAAQLALALFLAVGGGLRLIGTHPYLAPALAAACLFCGCASYLLSFRIEKGRNLHIYGMFGLLLLIAGTWIALPFVAAAVVWALFAVAPMRFGPPALRWHSVVYLLLASFASGALVDGVRFLLGAGPSLSVPGAVLWEGAAAAACYALAGRNQSAPLLRGVLAAAMICLLGAVLGWGLTSVYHGIFGDLAPHAYCATLRTAVLAGGALLLAAAGAHWKRPELVTLVYLVMLLGAYRLLMLDLREDLKAAVVLSLLVYGAALIFLPRLMPSSRAAA